MNKTTQCQIEDILNKNRIVLFMKGTASFPHCGFSHRAVAILKELNVSFQDVDVLEDPEIREGIKIYGDWPTIPQLYVNKQLIGGCDIMTEMYESGKLKEVLAS